MTSSEDNRSRLDHAAEEYFALVDRGEVPDREAFLARHAEIRPELDEYLNLRAALRSTLDSENAAVVEARASSRRAFATLAQGTKVARYVLTRELGRGGMGVVWSARDEALDEEVALKFLPAILAADRVALRALRQEAKVLLTLTHLHIVRLRTFETVGELSFLVMELLRGVSLHDFLDARQQKSKTALSAREALWVLGQVVPALEYAHGEGVTHRDLKPANLLLDRPVEGALGQKAERLKVADFGLAFVATSTLSQKTGYRPSGTLLYMAPEVLMGAKPTPAADIYSLGATLYTLLRGSPPFTHGDVVGQILNKEPEPLSSGDPRLDLAVRAAMSKRPQERPASPAKLLALACGELTLADAVRSDQQPVPQDAPWHTRRSVRLGIAGVAAAAIGAAWLQWAKSPTPVEPTAGEQQAALAHNEVAVPAAETKLVLEAPPLDGSGVYYTNRGALPLSGRIEHPQGSDLSLVVDSEIRPLRLLPDGRFRAEINLAADSYQIALEAKGLAQPLRFRVERDTGSPVLDLTAPAEPLAPVSAGSIELAGSVRDLSLRELALGGEPIAVETSGAWKVQARLPEEGANELVLSARDAAGNTTTRTLVVVRDTLAPSLQRCSLAGAAAPADPSAPLELRGGSEAKLELAFSEGLGSLAFDGRTLAIGADGLTAEAVLQVPPTPGEWSVSWSATDRLGNAASGTVRCMISIPSRWPEGWEALDLRAGSGGWARRVRDPRSGITFLLVEPGSCLIGSPEHEGEWEERPQHSVAFAQPFYLAEHETSVEEWRRFTEATKYVTHGGQRHEGLTHDASGKFVTVTGVDWRMPIPGKAPPAETHPVTQVNWTDAQTFCAHYGYRLPREVEWEYACRAGRGGAYWWGDVAAAVPGRANVLDASARALFGPIPGPELNDGFALTTAAEDCSPNPWGFKHMLGNVWEWCADKFDEEAYGPYPIASREDEAPRVIRGGSWRTPLADARCARRAFELPLEASDILGFRAAFDPDPKDVARGLGEAPLEGTILRTQIVRDDEGIARVEGKYQRQQTKEILLTSGVFQGGRRQKAWAFRYGNGSNRMRGNFTDGLESGTWRLYEYGGTLQAEGEMDRGWRKGRWLNYGPNGATTPSNWEHVLLDEPSKIGRRAEGATLDGQPEGPWSYWWPNGQKQLQGEFVGGEIQGLWLLWHADGTPEPTLVSGRYEDGVRVTVESPHAWNARVDTAIDLRRLTPAAIDSRFFELAEQDRTALFELFRESLADGAIDEREAGALLEKGGHSVVPLVLDELRFLSMSREADRQKARSLQHELLLRAFNGHSFEVFETEASLLGYDPRVAETRSIACWHSLWSLVSPSRAYWSLALWRTPPQFSHPPLESPACSPPLAPATYPSRGAEPQLFRKGKAGGATQGTEYAILEGLRWLARHQMADGSWSALSLNSCCDADSPCFDHKQTYARDADSALTAMAVLAFLRAGYGPESRQDLVDTVRAKRHKIGDIVLSGLCWLLDHQTDDGEMLDRPAPSTSRLPSRPYSSRGGPATALDTRLFATAIGAMALCDASTVCQVPALKEAAQRAINFLYVAQRPNPGGQGLWGWDYTPRQVFEERRSAGQMDAADLKDLFQADAVVTGWASTAMRSAMLAGLTTPKDSFDGAMSYIRWLTADDGLVGYLDPKGAGQSVQGAADHFQSHMASMSALGAWIRLSCEHDPTDPFLEPGARQLLRDLPAISKDRLSVDYHYWHFGTLALNAIDGPDSPRKTGKYWGPWNKAMVDAVISLQDTQERACNRGGWIVPDRWSCVGGPVYATAINVLTLETYYDPYEIWGGATDRPGSKR